MFQLELEEWGEISIAVVNIPPSLGRSALRLSVAAMQIPLPSRNKEERSEYKLLIHFDTCSDKKDKL